MREPVGGSAIPCAMTACSRYRPRWHISPRSQAEVTVRPFPWLQHVTSSFPRVFEHAFCQCLVSFLFSKLNEGRSRAPGKPVALCEQQLVFQFVQFEVVRVFSAMRLWLVLTHQHKRQFGVVDCSLSLVCSFLVVSQLYIHLITGTGTDS